MSAFWVLQSLFAIYLKALSFLRVFLWSLVWFLWVLGCALLELCCLGIFLFALEKNLLRNRIPVIQMLWQCPPPFWDPSSFSFKNFGPSSCAFLIKCTQQYLRTPINIMRNIWVPQTYFSWNWIKHLFNWHSEASSHYWQSRITSLQITIL